MKKIYLMTDLEGVAGVMDFVNWCTPESRYYELAKEFLTLEVNAAVEGFFDAGAEEILVADGHGCGGLQVKFLDPRVRILRGRPSPAYPFLLDRSYDAIAWVGQHAKSRSEYAHIAHTGTFSVLDTTVNGVSVGEFGEIALCASELGVRSVFASGDEALTREAEELIPGIETVAVKRGITSGTGDECDVEGYGKRNTSAIHLHPVLARDRIREGASRALQRAAREDFGIIPLKPPFDRVTLFRPGSGSPARTGRASHPSSVIGLFNTPMTFELSGRS